MHVEVGMLLFDFFCIRFGVGGHELDRKSVGILDEGIVFPVSGNFRGGDAEFFCHRNAARSTNTKRKSSALKGPLKQVIRNLNGRRQVIPRIFRFLLSGDS